MNSRKKMKTTDFMKVIWADNTRKLMIDIEGVRVWFGI